MDYSKFEKLAEQLDAEEKKEKEDKREALRVKYEKEQAEKQKKWDEKMIKEGKDPVKMRQQYGGCAFSQMSALHKLQKQAENNGNHHNHSHDHSDQHNHNHHHHDHNHSAPKSSCGYMPVDEMKRLQQQKKKEIPISQKNKKKIEAVYAAKTDGNRLFKEGNYELAYKVYERGVLIINGMYQLKEKQEDEMEQVEALLDLNMAFTSLKLQNWTEAINCCKMSIQINDKNPKAYYRWSEALIGMAEYQKAKKQSLKAKSLKPDMIAIDRQIERIEKLHKKQIEKAKQEEKEISKRLHQKLKQKQND